MEKQKRWQFYLILAVIVLTLYNILPTIFYYSKPLRAPIDEKRAENVATGIVDRVDSLQGDAVDWLWSYAKLLNIKPSSIAVDAQDPQFINVTLRSPEEAAVLEKFLPEAGNQISFVPSQLSVAKQKKGSASNVVVVARQLGVGLGGDEAERQQLFHFTFKHRDHDTIAPLWRELVYDRVAVLGESIAGASHQAQLLKAIVNNPKDKQYDDAVITVAKKIVEGNKVFKEHPELAKRWYANFTAIDNKDKGELINKFLARLETLKTSKESERESLLKEIKKLQEDNQYADAPKEQMAAVFENQAKTLADAGAIIRKNSEAFKSGQEPLTAQELSTALQTDGSKSSQEQILDLSGHDPFIQGLRIDWQSDKIYMIFYPDVQNIRLAEEKGGTAALEAERVNNFIIDDLAAISSSSDEAINIDGDSYSIALTTLTDATSFLALDLGAVAHKKSEQIKGFVEQSWTTGYSDLSRANYPIRNYDDWLKESRRQQALGLVIYVPSMHPKDGLEGFDSGSIYVIARGMDSIRDKVKEAPASEQAQLFNEDFDALRNMLAQMGFIGYPGTQYGLPQQFSRDYIFRLDDYYSTLLKATRENFTVKGTKRYAVLDFSDVEQRILALNKIDDQIQEDLLKWKEEYDTAQVDMSATQRYLVPPPTENPYWENFKLSTVKYFRGDDRKVLKWGLDLSGGKTVRIGLRDHNGKVVTNPDDLSQVVNELYTRINKMGVSERTIRIENNNIVLDFPGSQSLSAGELVKASAMYFHIVNEKFSPKNQALREAVNGFFEEIWKEAVVTNRKDTESINEIAWKHLGGETLLQDHPQPLSEYAKVLYEHGLRLANPKTAEKSVAFDDSLSSIAVLRGDDYREWNGQTTPLMIVFHNFALEGSSLTNIQVGYDPAKGNVLIFSVKGHYDHGGGNPRDDLYSWTSQYAEDKIAGTAKAAYTHGNGWRMAVILDSKVVNEPALQAALRDGGSISGRFSQREINQLASDLKAGSLSFTPKILSEQNISPELGKEERLRGIIAAIVALLAVVIVMVSYYRFGGVVASCAVLFNILIMWGVLQNIGAALTLPGIAGVVLTIGMAVDANVLVFERIREEFKASGRIASAIQAGYRKAFSAIVDSNVTTIIAALILIQFDSGPVKGFAVTLIIGIVSSMFTSLFMTRYFFAGWVQNPKNRELKMSQLIGETHINFLGMTRQAVIISLIIMLAGSYLFLSQRKTIFGMDFTGGYTLNTELVEKAPDFSYRTAVVDALVAAGASVNDVNVRALSYPYQLRIQLGVGMEETGHPFYGLPEEYADDKATYEWQKNPRLSWIVDALEKGGLQVVPAQLDDLQSHWTMMSGQFSDAMRNNALMGLVIALLAILIYITVRFEFKYAVGAVVGLAHDVVITLGTLAFLHKLGLPVQIDLEAVGAIMTIIGYSLNDTIIVFDRIREDVHIHRKWKFRDLINHALNVTLSRTIMTSGTTLLVLLALLVLGGESIFSFSLVMAIGVVVGTLSSLFISAPVMLWVHEREHADEDKSNELALHKM